MMKVENIVKKLLNSYVNDIVVDDGVLDFENTLYNFSESIMRRMDDSQQKYVFGKVFENTEDCYDYLESKLPSLRDELEKLID